MTDQSPCHGPTNIQRAQWAKNALAIFTAETYGGGHPNTMHSEDLESAIGDLICDLLHFARFHPKLDPMTIHGHALSMYEVELAEEEEGNRSAELPANFLDVLLDIKRLAEKSGDHEADPFALLDLIAYEVRAAIAKTNGGAI